MCCLSRELGAQYSFQGTYNIIVSPNYEWDCCLSKLSILSIMKGGINFAFTETFYSIMAVQGWSMFDSQSSTINTLLVSGNCLVLESVPLTIIADVSSLRWMPVILARRGDAYSSPRRRLKNIAALMKTHQQVSDGCVSNDIRRLRRKIVGHCYWFQCWKGKHHNVLFEKDSIKEE